LGHVLPAPLNAVYLEAREKGRFVRTWRLSRGMHAAIGASAGKPNFQRIDAATVEILSEDAAVAPHAELDSGKTLPIREQEFYDLTPLPREWDHRRQAVKGVKVYRTPAAPMPAPAAPVSTGPGSALGVVGTVAAALLVLGVAAVRDRRGA